MCVHMCIIMSDSKSENHADGMRALTSSNILPWEVLLKAFEKLGEVSSVAQVVC